MLISKSVYIKVHVTQYKDNKKWIVFFSDFEYIPLLVTFFDFKGFKLCSTYVTFATDNRSIIEGLRC